MYKENIFTQANDWNNREFNPGVRKLSRAVVMRTFYAVILTVIAIRLGVR
jgi:hypothetical protein